MNRTTPYTAVILLLVVVVPCNATETNHSSEEWETLLDLCLLETLLTLHMAQDPGSEYPERWVELRVLSKDLPSRFRKRIPMRDGWGSELLICSVKDEIVVVSRGPNKDLDAFTSPVDGDPEFIATSDGAEVNGDDMVLVVGEEILNRPRTVPERLNRTMTAIRSAATAVEEYSIDHNTYPVLEFKYGPLAEIADHLQPVYIRSLPVVDDWGNDLIYWSDGRTYVIVSPGTDGIFDQPYGTGSPNMDYSGAYTDPATDMVIANGSFEQWPEGRQN